MEKIVLALLFSSVAAGQITVIQPNDLISNGPTIINNNFAYLENQFLSLPIVAAQNYNFTPQMPGGTISPGFNIVTLSPCPQGVNGNDTDHWLYFYGGSGNAESDMITGGSCISGASVGTITFIAANSHSGAWSVRSVAGGLPEAIAAGNTSVQITAPVTIHGPVYCPLNQNIGGQGIWTTTLTVAADFPLTVQGLFIGAPFAGFGCVVHDFNVTYAQPDSTNISLYTHWPPTFYFQGVSRFSITNVSVFLAWDVVDMRAEAGGSSITNLQASMFDKGIQIDGAADSTYLDKVRFWPYGTVANQMTANQLSAFTNLSNNIYGLYIGRADDLHVTDYFTYSIHSVGGYNSVVGSGGWAFPAHFVNTTVDTNGDINITCGFYEFTNTSFSQGSLGSIPVLNVSNSSCPGQPTNVKATNFFFYPGGTAGSSPLVLLSGDGEMDLQITNAWMWTLAADISSISDSTSGGGSLIVNDGHFFRQGNTSYTHPTINVQSARATIIGNRTDDKGSGAGTFISVTNNDWNQVRANSGVGWGCVFPSGIGTSVLNGVYECDGVQYPQTVNASVSLQAPLVTTTGPSSIFGSGQSASSLLVDRSASGNISNLIFSIGGSTTASGVWWLGPIGGKLNAVFETGSGLVSPLIVDSAGNLTITGVFNQPLATPPSSSSTCITGTAVWDTSYFYVCTATNTWKRSALTTF